LEQAMHPPRSHTDYWSHPVMLNALMWGTSWSIADHFVPADRKQLFRQLKPDLYQSHNFRDNCRILILSEFQSQEKISTVLRTSDTRADILYTVIHTREPLVPEQISFEIALAIAKLKNKKLWGTSRINQGRWKKNSPWHP
jgi:hypothetical protein